MFKIFWVQKGAFHSAACLCVQRRISGGVESWALGIILLLFPNPELTHLPVHISWGPGVVLLISSLKNNLCFPCGL